MDVNFIKLGPDESTDGAPEQIPAHYGSFMQKGTWRYVNDD